MTKNHQLATSMLVGDRPRTGHLGSNMSGPDFLDTATSSDIENKGRRSTIVRKSFNDDPSEHTVIEPDYYMANYEATVTVHKSPPLARRPFFDFLEIDDETRDTPKFGFRRSKTKKNLKVSFSDHIEVDIISLIDGSDESEDDQGSELDGDYVGTWTCSNTETDGTISNSPQPSKSAQPDKQASRRPRSNVLHARKVDTYTDISPKQSSRSLTVSKASNNPSVAQSSTHGQPLLQKRRQMPKPLVSDSVQQKIMALNQQSPTNSAKRFSRSVFPDIVSTLRTDDKYKQFMSGVKRAVETTRTYERPWLMNNTSPSYQQNIRIQRLKSNEEGNVRRTSSLPKNFKLPDSISSPRVGK